MRHYLPILASLALVIGACTQTPVATPTGTAAGPTGTPVATTPGPTDTGTTPTDTPGPTDSATPEPTGSTTGGTLIAGEWQTPANLHPYFSNTFTTSKAVSPVFDGFISVNNEGEYYPVLATEVPVVVVSDNADNCAIPRPASADGPCFSVTVNMKPGLVWSDGDDLTVQDFIDTYNWALETAISGVGCSGCGGIVLLLPETDLTLTPEEQYAQENQYVMAMTPSADGLSVTIDFQRKYAGWLGWVGYTILPSHYLTAIAGEIQAESFPFGPGAENWPASGPFKIVAVGTDSIDYEANPTSHTPPMLDAFRYRYFASKDGMITAWLNGEVDFIDDMTQADYPALQNVDPAVGTAELHSAWQYEHLDLNGSSADVGLDQPEVRNAVHQAIDKEALWNVLFPGYPFEEACTNAPPGTWWRAEDVTCPGYAPDAAMAALDAAGWPVNADTGLRTDADGNQMRFQMCTTSGNATRLTTLGKINGDLAAVGIPSDIQTADAGSVYFADWVDTTPETQCSIYRGTYDVALFTYILGGDPGGLYYALYHTSQIPSDDNPNGGNDSRCSDADYDAQLELFNNEVDTAILLDAARGIQQSYVDLACEIALYYRAEPSGVGVNLGGFLQNPSTAGPFWNIHEWFHKNP
jgi:peptide/nickel transport system substrate-binding protein